MTYHVLPAHPASFPTILLAVKDFDAGRVVDVLDAEADRVGLDAVVDDVIFPALRTVGLYWTQGAFSVAHEHLFTAAATRWLHARLDALLRDTVVDAHRSPGRAVLLAAGPDDLHVIGLDCLELLLAARHVEVCNLGALVPADALVAAATALDAAAVVICSHTGPAGAGASSATATVREAHGSGLAVFYAGSSFDSSFVQRRVPGTALPFSVAHSAQLLARLANGPTTDPASASRTRSSHSTG
jgi:MerR family transcriptional regulator, light-induced transcriptional regulator